MTTNTHAAKRGVFVKIADAANTFVQRFLPDPFVIGVLLIAIIFVWGILATPTSPVQMLGYFGGGMWSLVGFAMQLSLVIVTSQTLANTPPVARALQRLARIPRNPAQAVLFIALFTSLVSLLNWGVGFVAGIILAREISKQMQGAHFPLLAASAYAGYTVWAGGLSSSIPLTLNTPKHPLEESAGLIPLTETIFSPTNLLLVAALAVTYAIIGRAMTPPPETATGLPVDTDTDTDTDTDNTRLEPAEKRGSVAHALEHSRILSLALGLVGLTWFLVSVARGGLNALNLNLINLLILSIGLMLYKGLVPYLREAERAGRSIIPIVVIYPLYAAIAGMITESGLGAIITEFFAGFATAGTLPVITFFTAGLINVFVPADGGHLVLQGPIFLELADQFGADRGMVVTAMAHGANWSNLLQPFWALPLLAIARLGIRDIMGYCFVMLLAGGVAAALVLGIAPLIF